MLIRPSWNVEKRNPQFKFWKIKIFFFPLSLFSLPVGGATETESWESEAAPPRLKFPSAMQQKEKLRAHPYNRYWTRNPLTPRWIQFAAGRWKHKPCMKSTHTQKHKKYVLCFGGSVKRRDFSIFFSKFLTCPGHLPYIFPFVFISAFRCLETCPHLDEHKSCLSPAM